MFLQFQRVSKSVVENSRQRLGSGTTAYEGPHRPHCGWRLVRFNHDISSLFSNQLKRWTIAVCTGSPRFGHGKHTATHYTKHLTLPGRTLCTPHPDVSCSDLCLKHKISDTSGAGQSGFEGNQQAPGQSRHA